ncbi:response regulator transcription factor [Agaribacterium haliotis]|nr:response regulator transcription factor [Agaribacterium haliotis]
MPERVLIIEDTKSFAMMLQKLLSESHSFECDLAFSMAEARELLAK